MGTQELVRKELQLAMEELDRLIARSPQMQYYRTLHSGLEMIASDVEKQWPLEIEAVEQLRLMSAYVARQLDYPEPGDLEYKLWKHIASIQDYVTDAD